MNVEGDAVTVALGAEAPAGAGASDEAWGPAEADA
jgi:hypothetical protein